MKKWLASSLILLWACLAMGAQWFNLEPNSLHLENILNPPSMDAWLGYDELGRHVFDRLIMGANTSFIVSMGVVSVSLMIGCLLGAYAGFYGGRVDRILLHIMDVFLAFPGILLAIALSAILGPGIDNVIFALSAVGWVGFARLTRSQVLSLKHREHVQAAYALGVGRSRIVFKHLIPLILAPLIIEATFGIANVVIAEAGLSFLGLGVQPPDASWGSMIRDGTRYMLVAPHLVLVPGISIMIVVMAVNLLGDQLRDYLDVRA